MLYMNSLYTYFHMWRVLAMFGFSAAGEPSDVILCNWRSWSSSQLIGCCYTQQGIPSILPHIPPSSLHLLFSRTSPLHPSIPPSSAHSSFFPSSASPITLPQSPLDPLHHPSITILISSFFPLVFPQFSIFSWLPFVFIPLSLVIYLL